MSLDITIDDMCDKCGCGESISYNITHNLSKMARESSLYKCLWCADEYGTTENIIDDLEKGINILESSPEIFEKFNPENGWGTYDELLRVSKEFLHSCMEYPGCSITVCK